MDKLTKDKIIRDFELITQCANDDTLSLSISLLKYELKNIKHSEPYHLNFCMKLMEMLIKETNFKSKKHRKTISALSDDEKYFLSSIYD